MDSTLMQVKIELKIQENKMTNAIKGYKATDENMQCRGLQFVLGEWQEVKGELVECQNGLHFCEQLAHTYEFYPKQTDRRFECECEDVLEVPTEPGVREKRVARRIRLVKEIFIGGDNNTGYNNTGYSNTGNNNTGYSNTGNRNTGYSNTGNRNTGYSNTGNRNTGNRNTGNRNTGYSNTGYSNTGNRNTGNRNTGDSNTGHSNCCSYSCGFFGTVDPKVMSFDVETEYNRDEFIDRFGGLTNELGSLLLGDESIDVEPFKDIPNITQERLNNLHQKMIAARKSTIADNK